MLNGGERKPALFAGGLFFLSLGMVLSLCTAFGNPHPDRKGVGYTVGGVSGLLGIFLLVLAACSGRSHGNAQWVGSGGRRPIRSRRGSMTVGLPATNHPSESNEVVTVEMPSMNSGSLVSPQPASPPLPSHRETGGLVSGRGQRRVLIRTLAAQRKQQERTLVQTRKLTSVLSAVLSNVQTIKPPRPLDMVPEGAMYVATLRGQAVEVDAGAVDAAKAAIQRPGCWPFVFRCSKPKGGVAEIRLSRSDDTDTDAVSLSGLSINSGTTVGSTVSSVSWKSDDDYIAVDPKALESPKATRRPRIVAVSPSVPGTVTPVQSGVVARCAHDPKLSSSLYRSACPFGCLYHIDLTAQNMCAFGRGQSSLSEDYSVVRCDRKLHFCTKP